MLVRILRTGVVKDIPPSAARTLIALGAAEVVNETASVQPTLNAASQAQQSSEKR